MIVLVAVLVASIHVPEVDMRIGEQPSWTRVAFDDVPHPGDVVTLRANVDLARLRRDPSQPLGIYFGGMAAHELWWDGVRIGSGGVVGRTRKAETPGPIESIHFIPDALATPGTHTLTIRASAFHRGFSPRHGYWAVIVGEYADLLQRRTASANRAMAAMSGFALTAVFAFAMFWLTRRDRSFLLLGTLCVAAAALLVAESWRALHGYTYDWHIVRLRAVVAFSWLVGVQLVALVVARFPHRHGRTVVALTAVAATIVAFIPQSWDPKSVLIFAVCCTVALGWTIFAAMRRMHGSLLALAGTAAVEIAVVANPWRLVDDTLYYALNVLFICLLCSHALEVRREYQHKLRLQSEVARRHMQPHFLMNTLTALSEWIEQEPKTAVRMIESLAEELRMLADMSTRTLVTTDEELRLCRTHLANMHLRRDVQYELRVDGVDGERLVPPAIFHTLVENAITHAAVTPEVVMRLSARTERGRTRYVFEVPASSHVVRDEAQRRGAGTRYIEARLREAWGNGWTFRQATAGAMWRAEIEVPA